MRGRILVIDLKTPTPDQDSGSTSTFSYLRILVEAGFEVTFAPYDLWKSGDYGAALNLLGVETLFRPPWWSMNRVIDKIAPRSDVVLLYRGGVAGRLFDRVRRAAPSARILFHPVDLSFLRIQRQAEVSGDRALAGEAEALRVTELSLIARADATIVVSAQEKDLLRQLQPNAVVHHIPILRETPPPPSAGFQSRRNFLFVGGFDHTPNVNSTATSSFGGGFRRAAIRHFRTISRWPAAVRRSSPSWIVLSPPGMVTGRPDLKPGSRDRLTRGIGAAEPHLPVTRRKVHEQPPGRTRPALCLV